MRGNSFLFDQLGSNRVGAGIYRRALKELTAGNNNSAISLAEAVQKSCPIGKPTPTLVNALHIQAVALARQGQIAKGGKIMDRVYASGQTNRSVLINCAIFDILSKTDAMRAVKNLSAFATMHPKDEQILNLWGTALDTAASNKHVPALDEQAAAYKRANAILEKTRPGEHHWGTNWISEKKYEAIQTNREGAIRAYKQQQAEADQLAADLRAAQAQYRSNNTITMGNGRNGSWAVNAAATNRDAANDTIIRLEPELARAQEEANDAKAKIPVPTWETELVPVDPELLK